MTTGQETTGHPPLYQSPQFQNEFPSLDGTGPSGSSGNSSSNNKHAGRDQQHQNLQQNQQQQQNHQYSHSGGNSNNSGTNQSHSTNDGGPQMSLRPQTEPSTWMQQQQTGNRSGGENVSGGTGSQPVPDLHLPPVLKAVMPSFMTRGAVGSSGPIGFGLPTSSSTLPSSNSNFRQRSSGGGGAGERGGYTGANDHSPYQGRRSGNIPPRLQNQRQQYDDHRQQPPLMDTEAIVHRPIIRDEELERIESIGKDDGWTKHDPLDYNQKLQFSDDETFDDSPPVAKEKPGKDVDLRNKDKIEDDKRQCKFIR